MRAVLCAAQGTEDCPWASVRGGLTAMPESSAAETLPCEGARGRSPLLNRNSGSVPVASSVLSGALGREGLIPVMF